MTKKIIFKKLEKQESVEGFMTIDELETGLKTLDFQCCEDVQMEEFKGKFNLHGMRDGNVYATEIPKRIYNEAIFREDHSSLSLGKDKKYYFYFRLPEDKVALLPKTLVREAQRIARKVMENIIKD